MGMLPVCGNCAINFIKIMYNNKKYEINKYYTFIKRGMGYVLFLWNGT